MSFVSPTSTSTLSFRNRVDPLEREAEEIRRRRERFELRKQRVLDSKTRQIGVDVESLNGQCREKTEEAERARRVKDGFDEMTLKHAEAVGIQREIDSLRIRREKEELAAFLQQQANEKRLRDEREKHERRQQSVAPVSSDPNGGVFLNFAGEDPQYSQRQRLQQSQQREWIQHQLAMKESRSVRDAEEDRRYAEYQQQITELQKEMVAAKEAQEKSQREETKSVNRGQMQLVKQRREEMEKKEMAQNEEEIRHNRESPFLNEDSVTKYKNRDVNFKGFDSTQMNRILTERERQIKEKAEAKEREEEEERRRVEELEATRREILRSDRMKAEEEKRRLEQLREEHAVQQREKQKRDKYINEVLYTNPVDKSYFQQFGTSHR